MNRTTSQLSRSVNRIPQAATVQTESEKQSYGRYSVEVEAIDNFDLNDGTIDLLDRNRPEQYKINDELEQHILEPVRIKQRPKE